MRSIVKNSEDTLEIEIGDIIRWRFGADYEHGNYYVVSKIASIYVGVIGIKNQQRYEYRKKLIIPSEGWSILYSYK